MLVQGELHHEEGLVEVAGVAAEKKLPSNLALQEPFLLETSWPHAGKGLICHVQNLAQVHFHFAGCSKTAEAFHRLRHHPERGR